MPTTPSRAKRWIRSGIATPFWKKGVFCVRLNVEPSNTHRQSIAVGIDPGAKREAFTIKSKAHTYLNIQTHANEKLAIGIGNLAIAIAPLR
jgi:RRXRR protein